MVAIKLLALDIDGVITDGKVWLTASSEESKPINFHDLDAITALKQSETQIVFLTGENGPMVDMVAKRFGVETVFSGAKDKLSAIKALANQLNTALENICYVGDSDRDAPALAAVGLGIAPANATPKAKQSARLVLNSPGGQGVVAEVVRYLNALQKNNQDEWQAEFARIANESCEAHKRFAQESLSVLIEIAQVFVDCLSSGGKLIFFGNGGSAADAQHVAGEFVGRFLQESRPYAAISLSTDTSIITAIGNDWTFNDVFARQIRALARPYDVAIGISTSGNSKNVLLGLEAARKIGAKTIGFTGGNGGTLATVSDICFCVPASTTPRIQELHILAWHSICEVVEAQMMKLDE